MRAPVLHRGDGRQVQRPSLAGGRCARRAGALTLAFVALAALLAGRASALGGAEKATVELQADRTAYAPREAGRLVTLVHVDAGWHVNSHTPTYDYLIPTGVTVTLPAGWAPVKVTYPPGALARFTFAQEQLSVYEGLVAIVAAFTVPAQAKAGDVPVVVELTYQACNDTQCLPPVHKRSNAVVRVGTGGKPTPGGWFSGGKAAGSAAGASGGAGEPQPAAPPTAATAPVAASAASALGPAPAAPAAPHPPVGRRELLGMLALGLLGGAILNLMPCVLPVLSLKVFSLVKSASLTRREIAVGGLATSLGILVSFWLLGGIAVAARHAGSAVGWGVHFQQPGFVALLAVVVVLFTLNMWGIFEVRLPGRVADIAGGGPREGIAGHFVTGLFATLMATPCSAPFLGTAVAFALAQPGPIVLLIFTAVGLGLASPYLVLAAYPKAARLLPRPGAWMVRLKEVLGFVLAAAAVWLFYVLAEQVSPAWVALVQLALLVMALVIWLGRSAQGWRLRLAVVAVLAAATVAVWGAASAPPLRKAGMPAEAAGLITWQAFDRARAEQLASQGTPVFVDVTADWCLTCKVNERLVLDTREVADAFTAAGVVAMRADWTRRDKAIGDFLAEHGRYGIPFYMLYRGGDRHVFPELITRAVVVDAVRGKTAQTSP